MSMYDDGEEILDAMAEEHFRNAWCPICETHAEDCVGHDDDQPPMVCKRCGALTPPISPNSREYGTLCQPCTDKKSCVHNPGSECVLIPAEPGFPLSDGKLRAPVKGDIDWSNYESMPLDQTESACQWFDVDRFVDDLHRGSEPNAYTAEEDWHGERDIWIEQDAYTHEEAEARRKEWNE